MVSQRNEVSVSDRPTHIARMCAHVAGEKKAENIVVLDVSKLTSIGDYFVVCSANSERQAQAIARDIIDASKKEGISSFGVEGLLEGHWILVDLGDVVFHVFTQEARAYYDLDALWADAPLLTVFENVIKKGRAKLTLAVPCES